MPRPRRCRRVRFNPNVTFFKPSGVRKSELEESILTVDEFEAIRLKDLECLEQEEAAKKMDISQPTFHRLIMAARKKVADALVNGKALRIEGGVYKMVGFGRGQGRMGGSAMGPGGTCVCTKCGHTVVHQRGIPCYQMKCEKCGSPIIRKM